MIPLVKLRLHLMSELYYAWPDKLPGCYPRYTNHIEWPRWVERAA